VNLGYGEMPAKRLTKPARGQVPEGVKPARIVREVRTDKVEEYKIGDEVRASIFAAGESVDVVGVSKGRGFQGVVKRHGFAGGRETHGSNFHRRPGSIGQSADPSRVFRGMKMPGRMGGKQVTVKNLDVVKVDGDRNLLLVRGAVPGARGSIVTVRRREASQGVAK
jgi:large subunit ribosomal protein L3